MTGLTTIGTSSGTTTFNGNVTIPTGKKITLTDTPSSANDAANKSYVDSIASGLDVKLNLVK